MERLLAAAKISMGDCITYYRSLAADNNNRYYPAMLGGSAPVNPWSKVLDCFCCHFSISKLIAYR